MLLVVRLRLLPSECRATGASDRLERDDVALTQTGDGALDRSRGCVAHADVMRDLVGDARSGRQTHQPQVLLHLLVVHDFQEGRLLELDGDRLAQRAVENRVAGGVGEVGKHQHIFVRKRFGLRAPLPEEDRAGRQNEDGNGSDPVL